MRKLLLTFCLALAACGGNSPTPQPAPISHWTLQYSLGGGIAWSPTGFDVTFPPNAPTCPEPTETTNPTCPSIHYIVEQAPPLQIGQTITVSGEVQATPGAIFNYAVDADNTAPGGHAPACRIYFEQAGDQSLSQPYFRWWANDPGDIVLTPGYFVVKAQLTPASGWTSVFGEQASNSAAATDGFNAAVANAQNIGLTCGGGSFYGHGVNMSAGSGSLTVLSYMVQ